MTKETWLQQTWLQRAVAAACWHGSGRPCLARLQQREIQSSRAPAPTHLRLHDLRVRRRLADEAQQAQRRLLAHLVEDGRKDGREGSSRPAVRQVALPRLLITVHSGASKQLAAKRACRGNVAGVGAHHGARGAVRQHVHHVGGQQLAELGAAHCRGHPPGGRAGGRDGLQPCTAVPPAPATAAAAAAGAEQQQQQQQQQQQEHSSSSSSSSSHQQCLASRTVGDEVQGQALEGLVAGHQVVAHAVGDQAQELVLLLGGDGGRKVNTSVASCRLVSARASLSACARLHGRPRGRTSRARAGSARKRAHGQAHLVEEDGAGHVAHLLLRVPVIRAAAGRGKTVWNSASCGGQLCRAGGCVPVAGRRPPRLPWPPRFRHRSAGDAGGAPGGRNQVGRVLHAKVDVVAQQARVQQLPHVLALVVGCAVRRGPGGRSDRWVLAAGGVKRRPLRRQPRVAPSRQQWQRQQLSKASLQHCGTPGQHPPNQRLSHPAAHPPVIAFSLVYFLRILPSSLSTRSRSASLVEQLRMSWM